MEESYRSREDGELAPSALLITSPYDGEARYSRKRSTAWNGFKVHFTETCDANAPRLIVEATATSATLADGEFVEELHAHLADQQILPQEHLMDAGYVDAEILAQSQSRYHVDVVGPAMPDLSRASKEAGRFDQSQFLINWLQIPDRHGKPSLRVRFPLSKCRSCPVHEKCTAVGAKVLRLRPDEATNTTLVAARQRQETPAFWKQYATRAGIEGTVAQTVRTCGIRQARYIGLNKPMPTEYPAGINRTSHQHSRGY